MARQLEIKRLSNLDYQALSQASNGFTQPVVSTLKGQDYQLLQTLKADIVAFSEYQNQAINQGKMLDSVSQETISSVTKDYKANQVFSIFLTKDKAVSPISLDHKYYVNMVEKVTHFFFNIAWLHHRLMDASILQKIILFLFLKKGIFGSFSPSNLSNFVNVGYNHTEGNTNTVIHSDAGLCNFFTQIEGVKRWWVSSPYQRKDIIQQLFQSDINKLEMDNPAFADLEYYDFQLSAGEMLYVPTNWLHGVVAPTGQNLSFYCRFPMTVGEMIRNIVYWRSLGIPVNRYKVVDEATQTTAADLARQQAEVLGQVTYHMQQHAFSSRLVPRDEPTTIIGLYDVDRVAKTVAGAE